MNCYYKLTMTFTRSVLTIPLFMFTLAFANWKYTVAAAYNLSVQVLLTIKMYVKFRTEKPYLTSL